MDMIKIVTDSSITIEPSLVEEYGITVIPLSVMVDGVVYSDNDLKSPGYFLSLMKQSKTLPKTSQPPIGLFAEAFEKLVAEGADHIVSIHLTPTLSGTIEAARQGAQLANAPVTILDSTFTDQALKFQVVEAAKVAQTGGSLEDVLARVEEVKEKTELYIGVSTLENLVKGGRISRVTGVLSSLLNVRVMMQLIDGQLETLSKGRGNKTFTKWAESYIYSGIKGREIAEISISYSGGTELALQLKSLLQPYVSSDIAVLETGSIIQTHTGEDAFAVMVRYA
ncbi:DegV family protein [Streptococcus caprae]|uniref:DegV family protein n=1 Tax=Streptococcus caprae TaxID=1640501 RepID=A0ABV8CU83_9STRE